ncbi:hypothetical protein E2C01_068428 [Portunus trituberculatus]|uniref:Uncharacterized protein n=1 Tax=Portunus trituberculatus TaxID=210409 RepID=A0A5B7HVS5_PORTR|nr:hypothetical protein [Portunus trituberculatus]
MEFGRVVTGSALCVFCSWTGLDREVWTVSTRVPGVSMLEIHPAAVMNLLQAQQGVVSSPLWYSEPRCVWHHRVSTKVNIHARNLLRLQPNCSGFFQRHQRMKRGEARAGVKTKTFPLVSSVKGEAKNPPVSGAASKNHHCCEKD